MSWTDAILEDLVLLQRGFDITKAEQRDGQVPVISSSGVQSYHNVAKVKGPGVIVGRKGSVGTVYFCETDYWPHDTTLWSKDLKGNDAKFVVYFLRTLNLNRFDTGNSNPTLNRNHIHGQPIKKPDLPTQQRIAGILSAYDDLIENNRRRIALLEQAARLLYREWFVHLRFPGHETAKIVDGLPEGWESVSLGNKAEIRKGRNITKETVTEGLVPVVAGGLKPAYFHNTANVKGPVITISASGANAGHVGLYFRDIWASDCSFISAVENPFLIFIHQTLRQNDASIRAMQKGAAQPHVYPKDLQRLPVAWPTDDLLEQFLGVAAPSYRQIETLEKQNAQLTRARDLLLPRLMDRRIPV